MLKTQKEMAAGFTLVEVMVTVFVVAIGLLGAAAMQTASKKAAFDAIQRSNATVLAQDMIERMRGNSAALATYQSVGKEISSSPSLVDCGSGKVCSPAQLAQFDVYQWWLGLNGTRETSGSSSSAAGGLRSPTACIQVQPSTKGHLPGSTSAGCRVTVAIAWRGLTPQYEDSSNPNDPTSNICGKSNPNYGVTGSGSGLQSYRRVLVIDSNLSQGFTPATTGGC